MRISNKEFCARLRKAKKMAVQLYPDPGCIFYGGLACGISLGSNAIFDKGGDWESWSDGWVEGRSCDDIVAVFDNSIRNLGEEP